jgi:DNA-binding IclR family transcriptional regulator
MGALNVAVPTVRFTPDRDAEFREALRVAAQAMAGMLA